MNSGLPYNIMEDTINVKKLFDYLIIGTYFDARLSLCTVVVEPRCSGAQDVEPRSSNVTRSQGISTTCMLLDKVLLNTSTHHRALLGQHRSMHILLRLIWTS